MKKPPHPIIKKAEMRSKIKPLPEEETPTMPPHSTAAALIKHLGAWVGDDLEQCLEEVYKTRSEAKF